MQLYYTVLGVRRHRVIWLKPSAALTIYKYNFRTKKTAIQGTMGNKTKRKHHMSSFKERKGLAVPH